MVCVVDQVGLLERNDEPGNWERPRNFDWAIESRDFEGFVEALAARRGHPAEVETGAHVQDASFHSQIVLPGGLLRFSNFGRMIAFSPDHEIPEAVQSIVKGLAMARGYVLVPTADLEQPYPHGEGTRLGIGTWWIRYFDYL